MAIVEDKQVGRFDVAVHDAVGVRLAQCIEQLRHQPSDLRQGKALVLVEVVLELATFNVFHGDKGGPFVLAVLVDRDNVGMRETAGSPRFALESIEHFLGFAALQLIAANGFQRNAPLY